MDDRHYASSDWDWVDEIPRVNGLFRGLVFAVPLGTAMWGLILWAVLS